jgi:hypothetical protein
LGLVSLLEPEKVEFLQIWKLLSKYGARKRQKRLEEKIFGPIDIMWKTRAKDTSDKKQIIWGARTETPGKPRTTLRKTTSGSTDQIRSKNR